MRSQWVPLSITLALSVWPGTAGLAAQSGVGLNISLAPMPVRVSNTAESAVSQSSGLTIGGAAEVSLGWLRLDLRYLEGGLGSEDDIADQDIVEGELLLGVAPLSWLKVKLGPHIRSFVTPRGTQRWVFWEGRLATSMPLGSPNLLAHLELWHVLSASVDAVEPFDSGNGLEGGIRLSLNRLPFSFRLAYRIDHSSLGDGVKNDTVEQLVFALGWFVSR